MKKALGMAVVSVSMAGALAFPASADSMGEKHIIGVPVYSLADEQVLAFREYLENYIGVAFEDVKFLYSQSIQSEEEELSFIQSCIDEGAEGIMAFNSFDLEAEVDLCAQNQVYFIRPAATPSQEEFDSVADNPYFLGYFGPGEEMEYNSGEEMASWFAEQQYGDEYFVFSGGAALGNAMHKDRTEGILDALQEAYGVTFDQSSEEIAVSMDPITLEKDNLKVTVCGGYVGADPFFSTAKETYQNASADVILSVIPLGEMINEIGDAKLGVIDCYTSQNSYLFSQGKLQYLCGKYSSIIGPAFAAMYNAVTGYAEDFREDGKAFAITQGFWTSESKEDFDEKFVLSSGIAINAYSYQDIMNVMKAYNPEATFEDLKTLGEAWDFESCSARVNK